MSVVVINRRQFLVGSGGAMLALPVLTSLLPATARAQASRPRPRFIAMASSHGCVSEENMYPSSPQPDVLKLFSDHEVHRGNLALNVNSGRATLSRVLSAPSSKFTQQLASKMNVIRGLDVSWSLGHHTGGHLGNFARNDTNKLSNDWRPTIDQVMAYSKSFYPNETSFKQRSLHVGVDGNLAMSWGYSKPAHGGQGSGTIQSIPTSYSSKDLFDNIFVRQSATPRPSRVAVVDRVWASYKSLHDGAFGDANRLSGSDRRRLEEHMDRIKELQQRVNVVAQSQCSLVKEPSRAVDEGSGGVRDQVILQDRTREFYQTFNDVIVAAVMCGTSRIATIYPQGFTPYAGDWHQEIAHTAQANDGAQDTLAGENQHYFEQLFLDLISKLDVEEADGKTFLDNSLVAGTQESGPSTHDPIGLPVVTAGSAAGFLKTGNYVDYRRRNGAGWSSFKTGLLYNQWLGTALQAMGIPREEFEKDGERGYGAYHKESVYGNPDDLWPDRLRQQAGEVLPFLKA